MQLKRILQIIDEFSALQIEEEQVNQSKSNDQSETSQLKHKIVDGAII